MSSRSGNRTRRGLLKTMVSTLSIGCVFISTLWVAPVAFASSGATSPVQLSIARTNAVADWDGTNVKFIGGRADLRDTGRVDSYTPAANPSNDTIQNVGDIPTTVYDAASVRVGSQVFVIGGYRDGVRSAGIDLLNFGTLQLTHVASLPSARIGVAAVVANGKVYVFGGRDANGPLADIVRFDPATGVVTQLSSRLPNPSYFNGGFFDGTNIWVVEGFSNVGLALSTITGFAVASETNIVSLQDPLIYASSAVMWDGTYAYLVGGIDGNNTMHSRIVRFAPSTNAPSVTGVSAIPEARLGLAGVVTPSALVVAGGQLNGSRADIFRFLPDDPPSKPENLIATASTSTVQLSWTAPFFTGAGTMSYLIRRSDGTNTVTLTASGTSPAYTDTSFAPGVAYTYTVTAVNGIGSSLVSNSASVTAPSNVPPSAPRSLSATAGAGSVALTWTAPSAPGSGSLQYAIHRDTAPGATYVVADVPGTTTSYTDMTAVPGTAYYYRVSAVNSFGEGPNSNEVSAIPNPGVPGPPRNLTATGSNEAITLNWNAPSSNGGASLTSYELLLSTTPGQTALYKFLDPSSTSFTDFGLTNGTTYYYRLKARNSVGTSIATAEVSATPASLPSSPQSLQGMAGNGIVGLSWTPPASNGGASIQGYHVFRGPLGAETLYATTGFSTTTYNDAAVTNGTTYNYRITAFNALADGPPSNEISVTPSSGVPPDAPVLTAATAGDTQVALSWAAGASNGNPISNYRIYRGTTTNAVTLYQTLGNVTIYTDTAVNNGTQYYYKVAAVTVAGSSLLSNELSAVPSVTVPSAPTGVSATGGDSQIALAWQAPTSNGGHPITSYTIYRGTTTNTTTFYASTSSVTSYTDSSVIVGSAYYYKVAAVTAAGEGTKSSEVTATAYHAATLPGVPTNVTATGGIGSVTISWQAPASDGGSPITEYTVIRGTTPGGENNAFAAGLNFSYTDTNVSSGTTYYYVVQARNAVGNSPRSAETSATTGGSPPVPPGPPRNLAATPGNGQVTLTWDPPTSNGGQPISNYFVNRSTTAGAETGYALIQTQTTYTDLSAANGVKYYYTVTAWNGSFYGNPSSEVSATPRQPVVPTAPRNPLIVSRSDGRMTLQWTAPSDDGASPITNYAIYRGLVSGGETALATVGNVLTYNDSGLTNGTRYYYKIAAVNGIGESPASVEINGYPAALPSAPLNLVTVAGNAEVTLTWDAPVSNGSDPFGIGYRVYRSTVSGQEVLLDTPTPPTARTYHDSNGPYSPMANGTTYYYRVIAYNSIGDSLPSNEANATPATIPDAPGGLNITRGDSQATVAWTAPASNGGNAISGYRVYRGTSSGGETLIASLGNVTSFVNTLLTNGTAYYYKVSAVNGVGESALSNEGTVTPATVPDAPTGVAAASSNGQIQLQWLAPTFNGGTPITGYKVYRGTTPGGGTLLTTLGAVATYTATGLTNGTTYYITIAALNAAGESARSAEVSSIPATVPATPLNVTGVRGNGQVALTWSAPASNGGNAIAGYRVYRGDTPGSATLLATLGNVSAYTNTNLTNGQTYYYMVSAVNGVGEGTQSPEVSAVPATIPSAPVNSAVARGNAQATLTWQPPASDGGTVITGYKVYRSVTSTTETLLTTLGVVTSFTNTGLTNGTSYYYRVSAINTAGEGPQAVENSVVPATVPSAPLNPAVTPSAGQNVLTWQTPSTNGGVGISGYTIYRGTASGSQTLLASTGLALTYTDTGLTNGTTYYYTIAAVNDVGESVRSNEVSGRPTSIPSAPQQLIPSASWGQISLAWAAPASTGGLALSSYRVLKGTSPGGESTIATVSGSATSYIDTDVMQGTYYYYQVVAVNSKGAGPASDEAVIRALKDTAPPTSTISNANNSVVLNLPIGSPGKVSGTAADDLSGLSSVHVAFTPTVGNVTETDATLVCNAARTSCTWTAAPPVLPGIYTVAAQGRDRAGNFQAGSTTVSIFVI